LEPEKPNRTKKTRKKPSQTGKTEPKPSQTEKTEPKQKKPSQNRAKTEPNRFEPVFSLKSRTEPKPVGLNRFRFGFGFF
jgi:hypothetical protein